MVKLSALAAAVADYRDAWVRAGVLAEHAMGDRYLGDYMGACANDIARCREALFALLGEADTPTLERVIAHYQGQR